MLKYTLTCSLTGESQTVVVCQLHAMEMPLVDRESVTMTDADAGIRCEFCPRDQVGA